VIWQFCRLSGLCGMFFCIEVCSIIIILLGGWLIRVYGRFTRLYAIDVAVACTSRACGGCCVSDCAKMRSCAGECGVFAKEVIVCNGMTLLFFSSRSSPPFPPISVSFHTQPKAQQRFNEYPPAFHDPSSPLSCHDDKPYSHVHAHAHDDDQQRCIWLIYLLHCLDSPHPSSIGIWHSSF
jgi:hypothetical protein